MRVVITLLSDEKYMGGEHMEKESKNIHIALVKYINVRRIK